MKSPRLQRLFHDGAASGLRWLGIKTARTDFPPSANGSPVAMVQKAGSFRQANTLSSFLDNTEPAETEWSWPEKQCWRFSNVNLVGSSGTLFFPDGSLWESSSSDARGPVGKIRPPLTWMARSVDSPCVHLCGMNDENRGHFVMEILPRLEALLSAHPEAASYHFLVPAGQTLWQARFFEFYGIKPNQLIEQGPGTTRLRELWMVPFLNGFDKLADPQWHLAVADRFSPKSLPGPTEGPALWVSRRTAPNKRILNEDRLLEIMEKICGHVESTELIGVPLDEQARIFRRSPLIVGGYGQGMVNTLFARDSNVLILTSNPSYKKPSWPRAFQQLAQIPGNRAHCLLGSGNFSTNENYTVDETKFTALFAQLWEKRMT